MTWPAVPDQDQRAAAERVQKTLDEKGTCTAWWCVTCAAWATERCGDPARLLRVTLPLPGRAQRCRSEQRRPWGNEAS